MEHRPDREVTTAERRLWEEYRVLTNNTEFAVVRIQRAGDQAGIDEQRVRQMVRTWENEGLVVAAGTPNRVELTEYGRQVDDVR